MQQIARFAQKPGGTTAQHARPFEFLRLEIKDLTIAYQESQKRAMRVKTNSASANKDIAASRRMVT
jgi:hypothetical protein